MLTQEQAPQPGRLRSRISFGMSFYRRNLPHWEKPGCVYFVNFSTKDEFVLPPDARSLVLEHCLFENGKKIHLHAVVIMPDHVHMLFTPLQKENDEYYPLANIMNAIKGAAAHSVNKLLRRKGALWLPESFDRFVRTPEGFDQRKLYIIGNPITAGLSKLPGEYQWCWHE
ncbi:MAG TPA: transposase [Candidatus Angelobacter sp.]